MRARSISLRLALAYTAAFVLAVIILGLITVFDTRATLRAQFESRISVEAAALAQEFRSEGIEDVRLAVRERDLTPGALYFGLEDASGRPLAGRLAQAQVPLDWSNYSLPISGGPPAALRVLAVQLPDGHRLLVGDELIHTRSLDGVLLRGFAIAIIGIILLGTAGAYLLSRGVRRRLDAISYVAEAVTDGDLEQRVRVGPPKDDLDDLGLTFNRMLDRIGVLMDSLHQVSNDIAHDLRTPLTRLRQRLESAQATKDETARSRSIEEAMVDLDAILETFAALLRIAQIEGGARKAAFRPVELSGLAQVVVESFAPSAEDSGRTLNLSAPASVIVEGDRELLTQMIVNLVENGLRHTPPGSAIEVCTATDGQTASLSVQDNGPGVPAHEYRRIFDRFYRLERSRTTQGSGLGLSLVSAVAKLHDAQISVADHQPGLCVQIAFPGANAAKIGDSQSTGHRTAIGGLLSPRTGDRS